MATDLVARRATLAMRREDMMDEGVVRMQLLDGRSYTDVEPLPPKFFKPWRRPGKMPPARFSVSAISAHRPQLNDKPHPSIVVSSPWHAYRWSNFHLLSGTCMVSCIPSEAVQSR
jgi:hypothetical protein